MAQRIVELHPFIYDIFYKSEYREFRENLLSEKELTYLQELVELLKPFENISSLLSGEHYVTVALIIPCFRKLLLKVQHSEQDSQFSRFFKSEMKEWLNFYILEYDLDVENSFLLLVFNILTIKIYLSFHKTNKKSTL